MAEAVWTIKGALDWTTSYLAGKGDENPRLSAEWLLGHACDLSRIGLYLAMDRVLTEGERGVLRESVARRAAGEPLQYILGEAPFRHISVKVRPGVLIPRPETEVLVSEALAMLPAPERRRARDSLLSQDEFDERMALQAAQAALGAQNAQGVHGMQGAQPGPGPQGVQSSELSVLSETSNGAESASTSPGLSSAQEDDGLDPELAALADAEEAEEAALAARMAQEARGGSAQPSFGSSGSGARNETDASQVSASSDPAASPEVACAQEPPRVLVADLCTGSGCIACAIASEHPQAQVIATDIEPQAVALTQENATELGVRDRVATLCCNLGEKIPARLMGAFDLVVSNPPYVPTGILATLPREVAAFEPALALDGGPDGNDVLRRILPWARQALKPGGALAVELHEDALDAAAGLAQEAGYKDVRIVKDLAGKPRVLTARTPS